jgi:NACalpha-BTF3-like transcription factor
VAALEANNFGCTQKDIVNAIMQIMTAAFISPKDIDLVMTHATCSRSTAVAALEANNFGRTEEDIVNAIMQIMEHDGSWRQSYGH